MAKNKSTLLSKISIFFKSDFGIALIIAAVWQIAMIVFSLVFELGFDSKTSPISSILSHTGNWDGGWYQFIVNGGYFKSDAAPAFFPLFPLAAIFVRALCFGLINILTAGFIVNVISTWLAITALVKIADYFVNEKYRWLVVVLFMTSPAAIFLHMFYSEAIFCALGFWAYLFALRKRWDLVGLALTFLTASRNPSVLFIGLCGLEYLRSYNWNLKKALNPKLLWFLLAPLGFISYALFLYYLKGNALAMFSAIHSTNDWTYHIFNPNFPETIAHQVSATIKMILGMLPFTSRRIVDVVIPLAGLIITGLTSAYAIFSKKSTRLLPLGIFGLVSIIFFTLNSNIVSVHRYLLPILVIYIVPVVMIEKYPKIKPLLYALIFFGILLQAYLLALFVNMHFAG